jgi:quercetin dioxygenase-like cupin family protein
MRLATRSFAPAWLAMLVGLGSCTLAGRHHPGASTAASGIIGPTPLVLTASEGERRVRRLLGGAPLIIKIDRLNGAAPEFVMGYEEIPPGQAIPPHQHLIADEIIFVHRGSGIARVGEREAIVETGATIYIPKDVRITLRNTGAEPLSIVFVFSKPGFEDYLRDTSVPEGQPVLPLSDAELASIRERHRSHTLYERP